MEIEPLRREVLRNPDDDGARRVLADVLTAAGDPQGPFIAHQLALASMGPLDPGRTRLIAATQRLQAAHAQDWLAPLLEGLGDASYRRQKVSAFRNAHFERGFLTRIALAPDDLGLVPTLRQQTSLEGVELLFTEFVPELAEVPDTSDWRWLAIRPDGWFTANSVARALCWGTASLESLDLSGCSLGTDGALLCAGLPTTLGEHFEDHVEPVPVPAGQLRRLVLKNTGLHDDGLAVLLDAGAQFAGLQVLDIAQCRLADGALLQRLGREALGQSLIELSLAGNNALDVSPLAGWSRLSSLEVLGLPKAITPEVFQRLLTTSSALRRLDLAGARTLLAAPELVFDSAEQFTHLNLSTTGLKDAGFKALLASHSATSLDVLQVNGCSLSDASVAGLVDSDLSHLHTLDVSSNKLSDDALRMIAGWPGVANLTHLRTRNNRKLSAAGYQALIDCESFKPVAFDTGIKDGALREALAERFGAALL